jgi:hypothetical protein
MTFDADGEKLEALRTAIRGKDRGARRAAIIDRSLPDDALLDALDSLRDKDKGAWVMATNALNRRVSSASAHEKTALLAMATQRLGEAKTGTEKLQRRETLDEIERELLREKTRSGKVVSLG